MKRNKFWSTVKPFLTNNGRILNDSIGIDNDSNLKSNEQELVELFNE